jgi:UDP-glucose:(heptosyl)LPS alpha-1,3-glucosyltransferase
MPPPNLAKPILLVTAGASPERGGQESSIRECAAELTSRGVTVTVAAPYPLGDDAEGIQYLPLGAGRRHAKERSAAFIREAEALIAFYKKTHIVHTMVPARGAHIYTPRSGVFHWLYRRSAESYESRFERALHRWALRLDRTRQRLVQRQEQIIADPAGPIVVAISTLMREGITELYGDLGRRVRVVRNGVDARRLLAPEDGRDRSREALALSDGDVAFLAVANNFRRKGVYELLKALAKLDERKEGKTPPRWKAFIAGSDDAEDVEDRVKKLGLWGRVVVLGSVSTVAALYSAADVLVHPTYYDPAGRVVLEALSVGLPVIVTRWDGAAEFIQGTEAGRLLDEPTDTQAFAYALERFCDPEERVKARASIRSHELSRKVSTARHVDEMMEIYAEVARGGVDATPSGRTGPVRVRAVDEPLQRTGGSKGE